jgi:acetyltransferase-like isoleucine patch superfamily enzyme
MTLVEKPVLDTRTNFKPFNIAGHGDVTFLWNKDYSTLWDMLLNTEATVYVPTEKYKSLSFNEHPRISQLIPADNPKLAFIKAFTESEATNIKETHAADVYRSRVELGNRCTIAEDVTITHTTMGDDCMVYHHVTLGLPALAMERDTDNKLYDFKHVGRLQIGNNVRIGQLTNIARGTMDMTIVEDDVRTDAHVNIAHNCHVRRGAILAVAAILGGSVDIGEDSWIGMNATIREHIKVGKNALVGMGAVVIDDVPDNDIVAGCPAVSIKHKVTLTDASRFMMVGYQSR